jgi:outer membrane lipoprotein-sorting protein
MRDGDQMGANSRTFGVWLLVGAAACGGSDEPVGRAMIDPAPGDTAMEITAPAPDSTRELPAGLAPVAVDDPDERTADQPTGGPSAASTRPDRPAGGGAEPSAPRTQPASNAPAESLPTEPAAEQDDGARILRRAAAAYEDVRSMQATFVMQFNNPLLRQQTTSRGTIYQQRPDRIALRFTDPAGDVILSDGEFFYIYQPSIDAKQATQTPASAGGGGGVDLQAQFVGNPTERFRHTLEGREDVGGRQANVMMLVPRERAEYRSLKVWFDVSDSLARRFEITEHNGSVRRFDLSGLQVNTSVPASVFRFTPPADVRVVRVG